MIHGGIVRRFSLSGARWALLAVETAALLVAAGLLLLGGAQAGLLAAMALATKGICGGPPTFEAMLYDMGPRDVSTAGLQRSLGMIAAITGATLVLAICAVFGLDTLSVMIASLAFANLCQVVALARLSAGTGGPDAA